jgi:hypothetical protein
MHRLLATITCIAATTAAAAEPVRLSNEALKTTFTGALVEMDTPAGTVIPVRFSDNGLVSGKAGVLASVLGAARDRGRWWTTRDKLCVKWFRWFDAKVRCVSVRQDGTRIYWRGKDRSGTGTIAEPAPVVAAPVPTPAAVTPPTAADGPSIELADTVPTPKVTAASTTRKAETAASPSAVPTMRFAAAALGAMSLVPPLARPSSSLHDGTERSAINAKPRLEMTDSEPSSKHAAPPPQRRVTKARAADARRQEARWKTSTQASSTVMLASFRVSGVDDDDVLNVRSGPSQHFSPIGGLPPQGRGIKIVGRCREDWCPIRHGRTTGWVNRAFLAEESPGSTTAAFSP